MLCHYCQQRQGLKRFKGYCCKAHYKLDKHPPKKMIACGGCGVLQKRSASRISISGRVYCTRCKRGKGENHYKWKEGTYIDKAGYRMVLVNSIYYKEHRLRWEEANQASLLTRGTIHHIRFDLLDNKIYNDPDNLLLLSDQEHGSFHRLFDTKRYSEAFKILCSAATRQLHYPKELDTFIDLVLSNLESS